jgi:hypothetical protein
MSTGKTYIVSRKNENNEFIFPNLPITEDNKDVLEEILTNKATSLTDGNEYESFPQIILHHCNTIDEDNENKLNLVFGFLITSSQQIIKNEEFEWKEYLFTKDSSKNQNIINETLMRLK